MAKRKQEMLSVLLLLATVCVAASADKWQRFVGSTGFSVTYPTTWFQIGISPDRLQLLSSKGGAEGVIIKRGQAEITVIKAEASSTKTLGQVIEEDTRGAVVLSQADIRSDTAGGGCSQLKEVISKEQPVPPTDITIIVPYIINTGLFCEIRNDKIIVLLRNWEGDRRQEQYRQTALRMAKSIKLLQ